MKFGRTRASIQFNSIMVRVDFEIIRELFSLESQGRVNIKYMIE